MFVALDGGRVVVADLVGAKLVIGLRLDELMVVVSGAVTGGGGDPASEPHPAPRRRTPTMPPMKARCLICPPAKSRLAQSIPSIRFQPFLGARPRRPRREKRRAAIVGVPNFSPVPKWAAAFTSVEAR